MISMIMLETCPSQLTYTHMLYYYYNHNVINTLHRMNKDELLFSVKLKSDLKNLKMRRNESIKQF